MTTDVHCATGFGLRWRSDIALDEFDPEPCLPGGEPTDVAVHRVAEFVPREALRNVNRGQVYADGIRFAWKDEAAFDMVDGVRVAYLPGARWQGSLPSAFYSTVAALTLAWRGGMPFHGCAVELGGRAVLIVGASGAGKSSLTAGLIGLGLRFVADDLAAVRVDPGEQVQLFRGRPAMRQHPDTAASLDAAVRVPIPGDPRGKWLVRPRARTPEPALPLAGMLVLADGPPIEDAGTKLAALAAHLFRPRWLAALPNHAARRRDLMAIAAVVPAARFPAMATFDPGDQAARAQRALAAIEAMIGR